MNCEMSGMFALYARQSVEREGSISIETQLEHCRFEVRSEPCQVYADKGFSGKNTQRPEFQRMLEDIRAGHISKVICYKLDRVSRSILDFAKMMDLFQKYNVEFVSSTEKFDTSTPMGRAMLSICIVFAQLERETIQKRVTDAYYSMAQKGFYLGGRVPYGFRLESTLLDSRKTSMYISEPVEKGHICKMFEIYAQPSASYKTVTDYFVQEKIPHNRNAVWSCARISEILRNPIYVKSDMAVYDFFKAQGASIGSFPEDFTGTNGCFLYKGREDKKKYSTIQGQNLVLALNEGFIESDIWLKCRYKALGHLQISRGSQPKNSWLAGKVKCGKCGYALTVRQSKSGRYFVCSGKANNRNCEGAGTIHADELEEVILERLKKKLLNFATLIHTEREVPAVAENEIRQKIAQIDDEAEKLLNKVSDAGETLMRYINERIEKLDKEKLVIQQRLDTRSEVVKGGKIEILENYIDRWGNVLFDDKRFVVAVLIERITVSDGEIHIQWNI